MACLGDDTIAALLEGGLPQDRAQQARAHLGTCDACRGLVATAIEAAPPPGSMTWRDGVIAGRYRVERPIGEGGMGRVVAARQLGLDRTVAIKILRPELARDAMALRRFQREARLVAQLASPHIVRVHDLGTLDTGEPFLVMELLDGEDLATRLARGPVPLAQAIAWIASACDALHEAHALGIVHRDIKPSNLFVTRDGRLVVVDFGLAKLVAPATASTSVTAAGVVLGSPHYMAPEQVRGATDVDARADIWSLAATLVHLITGDPPFPGPTMPAVFANILTGALPPLDGLPPGLAATIRRALARDPAARFATAGELAAALRAPAAARRSIGSRIALVAVAVLAIASVGFFVGRGMSSSDAPEPPAAPLAGPAGPAAPAARIGADDPHHVAAAPTAAPGEALARPQSGSGSATQPPAHISMGTRAPVIVGSNVIVAKPPVGQRAHNPGELENINPTRLEKRLEKLGWTAKKTNHEQFPTCEYNWIHAERGDTKTNDYKWADVTMFTCPSPEITASEVARMSSHGHGDWMVHDDLRIVIVAANSGYGLGSEEKQAKPLLEQLLQPQ